MAASKMISLKTLQVLLLTFAVASLVHFIHNAEFLAEYPGLPQSWTRWTVYGAWLSLTVLGVAGWCMVRAGYCVIGLGLLACYALGGIDSLGHYMVAPWSAHTLTMHITILAEVGAALLLFAEVLQLFARRIRAVSQGLS